MGMASALKAARRFSFVVIIGVFPCFRAFRRGNGRSTQLFHLGGSSRCPPKENYLMCFEMNHQPSTRLIVTDVFAFLATDESKSVTGKRFQAQEDWKALKPGTLITFG
jgi:hypothetical protein